MPFKDQVTTEVFVGDLFYWIAAVGSFLGVLAFALVDAGLATARNKISTFVQKIVVGLIAGLSFTVIGVGIWNWSFNSAFGVPSPLWESIKTWWIGSGTLASFAQQVDPKIVPNLDVQQVFVVFFLTAGAIVMALIHSAGLERMKASALYIMAVLVGGVFVPIGLYLTWGPVGPLSNAGVHDFVGVFALYMFAGAWSLVLAWKLGPRIGAFRPDPRVGALVPNSPATALTGIALLYIAILLFAMGCGFLTPGAGFFGSNGNETGFGSVLLNLAVAFGTGAISGTIIAHRAKSPAWALLGPLGAYIACSGLLDVATPLETAAVAFVAPFVGRWVEGLTIRYRIDEQKIVPLGLGCGVFGALATGVVAWGTKVGGIEGGVAGYELGGAEITLVWQAIGVVAMLAFSLGTAFVTVWLLDKTVGLRVTEEQEIAGLDATYWTPPAEPASPAAGADSLREAPLPGTP